MKSFNYIMIGLCITALVSCKKVAKGPFSETTYENLGSFDKTGLPNYLIEPDVISPQLRAFINIYFVDSRNLTKSNPELFTNTALADITISKPTTVFMTFVHQQTAGNSAIGFYTYPTGNPPKSAKELRKITYAFPNTGGTTPLKPGDKVNLGRFEPGISIGFVLMVGAWNTQSHSLNPESIHYLSTDNLNPEKNPSLQKHVVLIDYPSENKVLVGFEDQNRESPTCDHDFNDAIIYCTLKY